MAGYPRHRENRENGRKKIPFRENTGNLEILPKHRENTGNYVFSSCKFPDPKGKGYCAIWRENFHFFPEAGKVGQVSFVYVIATNYVNCHRENLQLDRENTGNLKMQFEWVPWYGGMWPLGQIWSYAWVYIFYFLSKL